LYKQHISGNNSQVPLSYIDRDGSLQEHILDQQDFYYGMHNLGEAGFKHVLANLNNESGKRAHPDTISKYKEYYVREENPNRYGFITPTQYNKGNESQKKSWVKVSSLDNADEIAENLILGQFIKGAQRGKAHISSRSNPDQQPIFTPSKDKFIDSETGSTYGFDIEKSGVDLKTVFPNNIGYVAQKFGIPGGLSSPKVHKDVVAPLTMILDEYPFLKFSSLTRSLDHEVEKGKTKVGAHAVGKAVDISLHQSKSNFNLADPDKGDFYTQFGEFKKKVLTDMSFRNKLGIVYAYADKDSGHIHIQFI
jgi:hypothetical protein